MTIENQKLSLFLNDMLEDYKEALGYAEGAAEIDRLLDEKLKNFELAPDGIKSWERAIESNKSASREAATNFRRKLKFLSTLLGGQPNK